MLSMNPQLHLTSGQEHFDDLARTAEKSRRFLPGAKRHDSEKRSRFRRPKTGLRLRPA
jgi:hypothetical protein